MPANAQVSDKNALKSKGEIRLQYPLDLESDQYPHRVDFTIYIPTQSQYKKEVVEETPISNYGPLGGDTFKSATSLAQKLFAAQGAAQIGKDAALGGAIASTTVGGGGGGGVGAQIVKAGVKAVAAGAGAVVGAATSIVTNSQTRAAAKGVIATELIKQTTVTGLQIERKAARIAMMISMYMPGNFFTTYGHDYDQISVKEAGGMLGMGSAVGEALGNVLNAKGFTDVSSAISNPADFLKAVASFPGKANPYSALAAGAIGSATQTPIIGGNLVGSGFTDVALFNMGYAQNPMLEILYRGTNFRSFQFEFMFQPKSADEAQQVREIIKQFKFHAAPETNPLVNPEGGVAAAGTSMPMFFVPPSEFEINLRNGSNPNEFLPKIGRCVLNRIDVDYSPGGQWQTYSDGNPVETRLRLEFTEIELVTKKKIDEEGF